MCQTKLQPQLLKHRARRLKRPAPMAEQLRLGLSIPGAGRVCLMPAGRSGYVFRTQSTFSSPNTPASFRDDGNFVNALLFFVSIKLTDFSVHGIVVFGAFRCL